MPHQDSIIWGKDCTNVETAVQPHCHITIKCTREIAGFNGLSDAFKRLDFRNAVRDIRRFNYICKLLDILITQNLTTLSGCAQKVLFAMLEEVAFQVSVSQQNIHTLNKLLDDLRKTLLEYYCWGRPLGSTVLWAQHLRTIDRIHAIANRIEIQEPGEEVRPKLEDLPEECIREILLRLADHRDVERASGAYPLMRQLAAEQRVWRELCQFHFTRQQLEFILASRGVGGIGPVGAIALPTAAGLPTGGQQAADLQQRRDWQQTYHRLRRQFGLREDYAEILQLCRNCRCLFWESLGHPCIADQDPGFRERLGGGGGNIDHKSVYVPVTPQAFLKFFSL